ncbi:hypothetical protein [Paramuribaculum intestinale]|uniref:hypothetical protein n=1 Tax=Paramuribaculum intestinale TaxID=2094151 RepID=UPI0025AA0D1B|nr:hypothetical protein [Paramuribaculum intestinale]
MKAIRKSDGKVIEVREWRGASDVVYSDPDMNRFYQESDLDFNVEGVTNVDLKDALTGVMKNGNSISCYGTERQLIDLVIRHFNRKYPDSEVTITIKPKKK